MKLDLKRVVKEALLEKHPFLVAYVANQDLERNEYPNYPTKVYTDIVEIMKANMTDEDSNAYQHRDENTMISNIEEAINDGEKKLKNKATSLINL